MNEAQFRVAIRQMQWLRPQDADKAEDRALDQVRAGKTPEDAIREAQEDCDWSAGRRL